MEKSEQLDLIAGALSKVQAVLKGAKQESENPFYKSKYADLTSVWDACRKPLTDNGLSVVQTTDIGIDGQCIIETMLLHNSGQWIKGSLQMPTETDPQKLGKLITYGRRYALVAIVGVSPDDDDAESVVDHKKKAEKTNTEGIKTTNPDNCTEQQRKKIFASSKQMGYTEKQVKDLMQVKFMVDNTKDLTKKQASDLIEAIEKGEGLDGE